MKLAHTINIDNTLEEIRRKVDEAEPYLTFKKENDKWANQEEIVYLNAVEYSVWDSYSRNLRNTTYSQKEEEIDIEKVKVVIDVLQKLAKYRKLSLLEINCLYACLRYKEEQFVDSHDRIFIKWGIDEWLTTGFKDTTNINKKTEKQLRMEAF